MTERFRLEIDRARWRCGGEDHQESAHGAGLSDEDREKKLIALAKQFDEEWVFVGEYPEKEDK